MGEGIKNVVVLGSTGSIGQSTLKVARDLPDRMRLIGLGAGRSGDKLVGQVAATGVKHACLSNVEAAEAIG